MAKRGPKEREIDYQDVQLLAAIFCSEEEIAEKIGFSYAGLRGRKRRDKELVAAIKRGRSEGVRSLRALQFQSAKKGSVAMLIWLGKQYLGQTDRHLSPEIEDMLMLTIKPAPTPEDIAQKRLQQSRSSLRIDGEANNRAG